MVGKQPSPPWLETDDLLAAFGPKRAVTIRRYREFVFQGIGGESIWINLKSQVFLGDEDFVAKSLSHADGTEDVNVPRAQRRPPPPPRLKRLFGVTQTETLRLLPRMQVEAIATRILAAILVFTLQQWRR